MLKPTHLPQVADRDQTRRIAEEAAEWLLKGDSELFQDRKAFASWLTQSPRHIEELLRAFTIHQRLRGIGTDRLRTWFQTAQTYREHGLPPLFLCDQEEELSKRLYEQYRRTLRQLLEQRRIAPGAIQELLRHICNRVAAAACARKIEDAGQLETYLYRMTCRLARAYQQRDFREVSAGSE